jgi:hypothetical protein
MPPSGAAFLLVEIAVCSTTSQQSRKITWPFAILFLAVIEVG